MSNHFKTHKHWLTFQQVEALIEKWRRACKGIAETGKAYEELTSRLDSEWIEDWTGSAERAATDGGETKNIYGITMDSGES